MNKIKAFFELVTPSFIVYCVLEAWDNHKENRALEREN